MVCCPQANCEKEGEKMMGYVSWMAALFNRESMGSSPKLPFTSHVTLDLLPFIIITACNKVINIECMIYRRLLKKSELFKSFARHEEPSMLYAP